MPALLLQRRLEWLGHVARMPDDRIPKVLLFGLLPSRYLPGGPRKRWRDCVAADLKAVGAPPAWYALAQSHPDWRKLFTEFSAHPTPARSVSCDLCHRDFSRPSDLARHKCIQERSLPVQNQRGAVQCSACQRWFRSKGGRAVHSCPASSSFSSPHPSATPTLPHVSTATGIQCSACHRELRNNSGFSRHKCVRAKRCSSAERTDFQFMCDCGRKFRRKQDLSRHKHFCD